MEPSELLRYIVGVLEKLNLRYFVTGSFATIHFGEPRLTNDIDIVVDLTPSAVSAFCAAFPGEDFYVSEDAVRRAVEQRSQFNIIHPASGFKIDVMVPADTQQNRMRFGRTVPIEPAPDFVVRYSSPEDVIIKKMEAYRQGESDKHLRDITGVLRVSGRDLDREYLGHWITRLGLGDIWRDVNARLKADTHQSP